MKSTLAANGASGVDHDIFAELRLTTRIVSVPLLIGGLVIAVASSLRAAPTQVEEYLYVLGCYLAAGLIELSWRLHPTFGRWIAVMLIVVLVPLSVVLWMLPGLLVLIPVPILVAMSLLGTRGGVVATLLESGVIAVLTMVAVPPYDPTTTSTVVLCLWFALGVFLSAHRPIRQMEAWSHTYIDRAQKLLDQARDRNAELDQVLKELVHVNRQLDLTNERLAAARAHAEAAQKSKAEFVAIVSHEFRTPLNMIIGLTDFLLQQAERDTEEFRANMLNDIRIIHRNSEHLSTMINDVLDLSQVEVGQPSLHRQWTDLGETIAEALNVVEPLLVKKQLAVETAIPADLPQIYCDPVRIRQVALNLISNAARHTDTGSIRIGVALDNGYVTVRVTDTGPGITKRDLTRIFEPFYRGESSARGQGSGLGLTVSKQLIEQHNGKIWVESELDKGSTFAFRLPVMPLEVPSPGARGWINEEWIWRERTERSELPKISTEWRVIICDEGGRVYPLFSRFTNGDVELVETQNLAQAATQIADIPAHMLVVNEENPAELWQKLLEARSVINGTPLIGCSFPPSTEHEMTPDIVDYLVKPVTRADLCGAIESLPGPVQSVLVVDDDPDVRALFVRMLLNMDAELEIATAADGDAALAWLQDHRCDLVLLDIVMPQRDGWSVLHEKQALPHVQETPVIIMSAQDLDVQAGNSVILAVTDHDGLSGETIVQTAFHIASRLHKRPAILD